MSVIKNTENCKKKRVETFEIQNDNSVADFASLSLLPAPLKIPVKNVLDVPVKPVPQAVFAPSKNIFNSFFFKNLGASITTGLVFSGLFCFALYTFATYPTTPYSPGDTLSPECAPGASNCSVVAPAAYSFGANNFSGSGTVTANGFLVGTKFAVDANGNITKINNVTYSWPANDGDSGQVLSSDGSGTLSWVANGAGSMVYPGAGIAVSTGSAWGSSLTDNHSNWDAGYSHKTTEDAINGLVFVNGAGTYSAKSIGTDVQAYDAALASLAGVANPASAAFLKMGTDGAISTDTSTYLTSLSGALLATGATTGATSQIQIFTNGVQTSVINGGSAANDDITIQGTTDSTRTTSYVNLQPNGGNVGIGTTTPTGSLDVRKSGDSLWLVMRSDTLGAFLMGQRSEGTLASPSAVTSAHSLINISGGGYDGSNWVNQKGEMTIWASENWSTISNPTTITFTTTPSGSVTAVERMRIESDGKVGIGNTAPGAMLDIGTATSTLGTMRLEGSTSGYVQIQPAVAAGSWTLTLPGNDGDSGQFLQTNGSGVATWATALTSVTAHNLLSATHGDTTTGSAVRGDIITAQGASPTWTRKAKGSAGQLITFDADDVVYTTATYPGTATTTGAYMRADGTNWISSTLVLPNSGTAYKLAAYTATNTLTELAAVGATGQILQGNTGAIPSWSTATFPSTATSTGTILRADGTNWVASTATYPNTTTANQILYSTATNTVGGDSGLTFDGTTLTVGSSTEVFTVLDTGKVGINATSPTYDLSFGGDATRTISLERNTTTNGSNLTLSAGGALSGGTNLNAGMLYLKAGISTGSGGSSDIFFQTATSGSSGTSDNTPTTKLTVRGNGNVVVGTAALTTDATSGFLYLPSSAGTPTGVPTTETGTVPIQYDTTNNALMAYRGGAWRTIAETGGFQIPDYETVDPVSGVQMQEGDLVMGVIDGRLPNDNLHAVWVKWSTVKDRLLAEARGELQDSGTIGTGEISGVEVEGTTFLEKVKNIFFSLGIEIKDGVTNIASLATQKFSADTADIKQVSIQTMQMIDQKTGETYCTWIVDGEWVKEKGECSAMNLNKEPASIAPVATPIVTPVETPEVQPSTTLPETTEITQQQQHAIEQAADQAAREASQQTASRISDEVTEKVQDKIEKEVEKQVEKQLEEKDLEPVPEDVEVQPEPTPAPEPIVEPAQESVPAPAVEEVPSMGDLIQEATSGLFQQMWEFFSWIFKFSSKEATKIIPDSVKRAPAGLFEAVKIGLEVRTPEIMEKSTAGMLEPIKNLWSHFVK